MMEVWNLYSITFISFSPIQIWHCVLTLLMKIKYDSYAYLFNVNIFVFNTTTGYFKNAIAGFQVLKNVLFYKR